MEDADGNLIEVGTVLPPHSFAPSHGLDYMFVLVYDSFWEDEVSKNMLYSPRCDENKFLSIIPIADKTLSPNFTVCAFGGKKDEMVCGEILEFGVTVKVPEPGSNGLESVDFAKVVKVNMTNDYDPGYMGAPV